MNGGTITQTTAASHTVPRRPTRPKVATVAAPGTPERSPAATRMVIEPLPATPLPRGGVYVSTALGAIQVGIPPETIKDSLALGFPVPQHYVIPRERFYRELGNSLGINVAEFEFPAYYNFFLKNQKVKLIVERADEEARIRAVLQETLFGPKEADPSDFSPKISLEDRPDLAKETEYFSRYMGQQLTLDSLVSFIHMKDGVATIEGTPGTDTEGIRVEISVSEENGGEYIIDEITAPAKSASFAAGAAAAAGGGGSGSGSSGGGSSGVGGSGGGSSAKVPETRQAADAAATASAGQDSRRGNSGTSAASGDADPGPTTGGRGRAAAVTAVREAITPVREAVTPAVELRKRAAVSMFVKLPEHNHQLQSAAVEAQNLSPHHPLRLAVSPGRGGKPREFKPPVFGVTVLGNSHGFDPTGSTSGYVLWINRRGYMIDPPPYASMILANYEIRASLIDGVILTHCHADHDAGTFQKILFEGQVNVITTPTIYKSFIRKYSELSGLHVGLLENSHKFCRVTIGDTLRIRGASFDFFYTLHSIPCVGFVVRFGNRSIAFSADHMNDPERIKQMHAEGVLGDGRCRELLNFPWNHDVIFHEAGIPPIHTPMKTLEQLPDHVKRKLYVVHVSPASIPPDSGLRVAPLGVEATVSLEVETPYYSSAVVFLDLLSSVAFFRNMSIRQARDLLEVCVFQRVDPGQTVQRVGQAVEELAVISRGRAMVHYSMDLNGTVRGGAGGGGSSGPDSETPPVSPLAAGSGGDRGSRTSGSRASGFGIGSRRRASADAAAEAATEAEHGRGREGQGPSRDSSAERASGVNLAGLRQGQQGRRSGGSGAVAPAAAEAAASGQASGRVSGAWVAQGPQPPANASAAPPAAAGAAAAGAAAAGAAATGAAAAAAASGAEAKEARDAAGSKLPALGQHSSPPRPSGEGKGLLKAPSGPGSPSSPPKLAAGAGAGGSRPSRTIPPLSMRSNTTPMGQGALLAPAGSGAAAAAALSDSEDRPSRADSFTSYADATLMQGDWFGEEAVLSTKHGEAAISRIEVVAAESGVEVYKFRRNDLKWILDSREGKSQSAWPDPTTDKSGMDRLFMHNDMLRRMSRGQKLLLESMATTHRHTADEVLWSAGDTVAFVVVVVKGSVAFEQGGGGADAAGSGSGGVTSAGRPAGGVTARTSSRGSDGKVAVNRRFVCPEEFGRGALVGCVGALLESERHLRTLRARTNCTVLRLACAEMLSFAYLNPGVFLSIHDLEFAA